MDSTGEPVVLDFGLARLIETGASDPISSIAGVAGTPAYMAPEQVTDNGDVDTRTDVFMLGLLMYEVLALTRARDSHETPSHQGNLELAKQPPIPIQQIAPSVSTEIASIVGKATEMDPRNRYQSVEALLLDLERLRKGAPVRAMSASWIYRFRKFGSRHLAYVAGAVAVALILISAQLVSRATQQYAEEAYGRATQVTQRMFLERERILDRRMGEVCQELADLYAKLGNRAKAEMYAEFAERARLKVSTLDNETPSNSSPPSSH